MTSTGSLVATRGCYFPILVGLLEQKEDFVERVDDEGGRVEFLTGFWNLSCRFRQVQQVLNCFAMELQATESYLALFAFKYAIFFVLLDQIEDEINRARNDAGICVKIWITTTHVAFHRVRLASACLPIGKDAHFLSINHRVHVVLYSFKYFRLIFLIIEYAIKNECSRLGHFVCATEFLSWLTWQYCCRSVMQLLLTEWLARNRRDI